MVPRALIFGKEIKPSEDAAGDGAASASRATSDTPLGFERGGSRACQNVVA
jgi:hypothetical protein